MKTVSKTLLLLAAGTWLANANAEQAEEILKVKKSTFVNLVDLLVQRGVINQQEASGLVTAAQQEAASTDASQPPQAANAKPGLAPEAAGVEGVDAAGQPKNALKSKHVSYIPEFVKKEIRDQVRAELKSEVVQEVKQDAKSEGWGVPGALPEWVSAIHPTFDARVRFQNNFFDNNNAPAYNYLNINAFGLNSNNGQGLTTAISRSPNGPNYGYLNNTKNQLLIRERLRLGFEANIADGLKAGVRFATSNIYNPVSNDQTLGNTGQSYQFAIDRSYLQYDYLDSNKTSWFSLYGGRIINPFLSTDVVFDPDLSFEGVAGSFRFHMNENDPVVRGYKAANPTGRVGINQGQQTPDSVFLTLGVFPIQSVNFASTSKWLYAGQLGADWLVFGGSRFNIAGSYYDFENISGRYNSATGTGHEFDWTAPQFMQRGNSMVAITDINSAHGTVCTDSVGCLFGLASGFKIFNATAVYDYTYSGQTHVLLTADYANNLGFNQQQIYAQFHKNIAPRTSAFQVRLDVGRQQIMRFGDWNMNFAYRYIQRDAVLDAFTDSQFHNGGTDAKGWVVGTQYGLAKNTWVNMQWYSTEAIDGPKYTVDTLNLDVNARF